MFLDFAKAFDKIPHIKTDSENAYSNGIQGKILDWITEWLKGRKQKVGIRGRPTRIGDGSMLFLIYIKA